MGPFGKVLYGSQTRPIGSWFADEAWFVWNEFPWFLRGGSAIDGGGISSGLFAFGRNNGYSIADGVSFRVVLSP